MQSLVARIGKTLPFSSAMTASRESMVHTRNTLTLLAEAGGYGDHVTPFTAPEGTEGEWLEKDPYGQMAGPVPVGES